MLRYYIIAFFSGAAVLMLEVLGARIIAPYLGTSFFVWVNVIGVILASLSCGYWLGGVLADKNQRLLPWLFLFGAFFVIAILPGRALIPYAAALGIRAGSLVASLYLFAAPSLVLGMVSPYLIKLVARDMDRLGKTSGSMFALSTIGSIAGTFITGFWLVPMFAISQLLWGLGGGLVTLAGLSLERRKSRVAIIALGLAIAVIGPLAQERFGNTEKNSRVIFEKNSRYYNIRVHDAPTADGAVVRTLLLDGSTQSAKFLAKPQINANSNADELGLEDRLFPYTYIELSAKLISALAPNPASLLAIGGGGYSIPEYVKTQSPHADVTVVEIDPKVTETAQRFFLHDPGIAIQTIAEDGRTFLNNNRETFAVVYTDAYSGAFSVPGHLASREAFLLMEHALSEDGVLIMNIASALEGERGILFRSLWKTFDDIFPHKIILATAPRTPASSQNIIVVAAKQPAALNAQALQKFESWRYKKTPDTSDVASLTDEYAPTDHLVESLVADVYPYLRAYHQ
ncbi:MAG: fused MFS/spermidine synthase [bacterium]|nr:fused MFS/spermidine synthase [bacterium]